MSRFLLLALLLLAPARVDEDEGGVSAQLDRLQVGRRARALGLGSGSALAAWREAEGTLRRARARLAVPFPADARPFAGTRASELNALLGDDAVRAVRVASPALLLDEPLLVARSGIRLDLGAARLRAAADGPPFLLRIEEARDVTVTGGRFLGGRWAVLVRDASDVTLRDGRYEALALGGIAATRAPGLVVAHGRMSGIGGPALLLHGATRGAAIVDNEIVGNLGGSNWHAGIVVTDRAPPHRDDPTSIYTADHHGVVTQPIDERLEIPRHNVVARNRVAGNRSSGIYSDGGVENVFLDNVIEGNAKEGVCLDNGSTANVLARNVVRDNGRRWGKSDDDLRRGYVLVHGRLADGTAAAKVPGISLDNAVWNLVHANRVERNHGGGIKAVRSAFLNTIARNVLADNNLGASDRFHFFAIELGAAVADEPVPDLDFAPSRGNVVVGNEIRGAHHSGIYLGAGSTGNEAFDNAIRGASHFAFEQARPQANRIHDNRTGLPSLNLGEGGGMLAPGIGKYDLAAGGVIALAGIAGLVGLRRRRLRHASR